MNPFEEQQLLMTRRRFFGKGAKGIGLAALAGLLNGKNLLANGGDGARGLLGSPHAAPKAKRVIFLFQSGAPSQIDLFDHKPHLNSVYGQDLPDSVRMGQRLTGMTSGQSSLPVAPSFAKFRRCGDSGQWISDALPYHQEIADELCFVKSLHTEAINHDPGITFFQTGHQQPGRPSIGSWVSYGLGSDNDNLPSFCVLISNGDYNASQPVYARLWGSGFLPTEHQGVRFRSSGDAVLYLNDPKGISKRARRRMLDGISKLNAMQHERVGDPEINTRIAQYEMAYRMQMSVPDLMELDEEPDHVLDMYGDDCRKPGSYAFNCLMARRLAERGVRFIQLFHTGWDNHSSLPHHHRNRCRETDQPSAALIKDLKQRGMLEDTLVIWGGEFGRTVYSQGQLQPDNFGRDHHPRCFTMWMAGGGVKPGFSYGETDDYCYNIVRDPVDVHDFHATVLHLLGVKHEQLTYFTQGRRFRLTDVFGKVKHDLIA